MAYFAGFGRWLISLIDPKPYGNDGSLWRSGAFVCAALKLRQVVRPGGRSAPFSAYCRIDCAEQAFLVAHRNDLPTMIPEAKPSPWSSGMMAWTMASRLADDPETKTAFCRRQPLGRL
jgi:hypothetical protein